MKQIIRRFARESATPLKCLWQVADDMVTSMEDSLAITDDSPSLNMVVSNATLLPLGYIFLFFIIVCDIFIFSMSISFFFFFYGRDEEGFYYGVSLHGRNLLMLCARLGGKNKPISALQRQHISIPDAVMAGSSLVILP